MISELVRTNVALVDRRESVSRLFGYARGETGTIPVIGDEGYPYGVPHERMLARYQLPPEQKIGGAFAIGTKTLAPTSPVSEAIAIVAHNRIPFVPVVDGERLVGVVLARDLLAFVEPDASARALALEVPLLGPGSSVGEALHHLRTAAAPCLPCVDAEGRFGGVVWRRAVLRMEQDERPHGRSYAGGEQRDPNNAPVEGLVERDVATVEAEARFGKVREKLEAHACAVVLLPDGRPGGVLTPEGVLQRVAPRTPLRPGTRP